MKRKNYYIIPIMLLLLTSCEDWLDVKPKAQIEEDVLYQQEGGFKDVLYNAYINMITPAMYGGEMTFGMVDVLGYVYPQVGSLEYMEARNGNYADSRVEAIFNSMWQTGYNTIANLNNLIKNLKTADRTLFSKDNYNVVLGEAYGLRALLHFDLLRLFAPSYQANAEALAIPYITQYSFNITPQYTVSGIIDSVLIDLRVAADLLRESDPIATGRQITAIDDDGYLLKRPFRFNYYAVKAVMARVYLYKSDFINATLCADEVINSGKFSWLHEDRMVVTNIATRDRTFSSEQIFVLHVPNLNDNTGTRLHESGLVTGRLLRFTDSDLDALYPSSDDWRKLFLWTPAVTSQIRYTTKLEQPEGMPDSLTRRMPVIRFPELYLISAEAALSSDPEKTRSRINELRRRRECNIEIPAGTAAEILRTEILQEYRREFIAEGILFYYYKRLDSEHIEGLAGTFDKTKYILPLPLEEIEFGNRH
ncbi:MAG: RagB/SusD family nutrient uptake outer membrane protein [Prevotellaceae bacterium]|jgi:hypothetical protein|nr:RagB/SusD family nutrient uptake outer membrane protein [Prevotellaceae bacterium]